MALLLKKNSESKEDLYRPHIKEVDAPISKTQSGRASLTSSNAYRRSKYNPVARHERYLRKKNNTTKIRKKILSDDEIRQMRKFFNENIATRKVLAEMFNCSYSTVCKIISREYFKDVE